jgi:hypothetical protein
VFRPRTVTGSRAQSPVRRPRWPSTLQTSAVAAPLNHLPCRHTHHMPAASTDLIWPPVRIVVATYVDFPVAAVRLISRGNSPVPAAERYCALAGRSRANGEDQGRPHTRAGDAWTTLARCLERVRSIVCRWRSGVARTDVQAPGVFPRCLIDHGMPGSARTLIGSRCARRPASSLQAPSHSDAAQTAANVRPRY